MKLYLVINDTFDSDASVYNAFVDKHVANRQMKIYNQHRISRERYLIEDVNVQSIPKSDKIQVVVEHFRSGGFSIDEIIGDLHLAEIRMAEKEPDRRWQRFELQKDIPLDHTTERSLQQQARKLKDELKTLHRQLNRDQKMENKTFAEKTIEQIVEVEKKRQELCAYISLNKKED